MFKNIAKPTIVLTVICLVISAALAVTHAVTLDTIAQRTAEDTLKAQLVVLPAAQSFENKTIATADGEFTYAEGYDANGAVVGYVFQTNSAGYGGDIAVMTGIDTQNSVTGVTLLSNSETPGLGKKAENEDFTNQYKQSMPESGFQVVKGNNAGEGEIDAITGATITSNAVTDAVNQAITLYQQIQKGGAE